MNQRFSTSRKTNNIFLVLALAALAFAGITSARGQDEIIHLKTYFAVHPLADPDFNALQEQSNANTGLKVFTYHATSTRSGSKGQKFTGMMVGNSPFTSNATSTETMQIVPVIVTIGNTVFDPRKANGCDSGKVALKQFQGSPLVLPASFKLNGVNVGTEQYSDAFTRASFWKPIVKNGGTYNNNLKVVTLKPIHYSQGSKGVIIVNQGCGPLGGLDFQTLMNDFEKTVIPKLQNSGQGVGPTTFPVFMLHNVVMYIGNPNQCCVLGFHGAFNSKGAVQTYSPFDYDTTKDFVNNKNIPLTDTYFASHEINEWTNDPFGVNPTPAWGNVGQVQGCQNNLEVGDPLTGTNPINVKMSNGMTYELQELAFFSWFYGPPSIGTGGKFSDNGTFTAAQGACH
jgi:hypothetical protein